MQNYIAWFLGGIVWGSDGLWVDLGGSEGVVSEKKTETVVMDASEGDWQRLDLEKVPEVGVQNVEMTLQ